MPRAAVSRRAGMTLVELLVTAAVSLLLLGMLAQFLAPTMRATARGNAQGQLHQTGAVAMSLLTDDLQKAPAAGIGYRNSVDMVDDPAVVAIQPLLDVDPDGRPVYATSFTVYFWRPSEHRLYRKQGETAGLTLSSAEPTRLDDVQLLALADSGAGARVVATEVSEFALTSPVSAPNIGEPLTLILRLSRDVVAGQPPETFQLVRQVYLRNPR